LLVASASACLHPILQNWGLLLFDERHFLYSKDWDGAYGLLQAVNVICHELAHQW
jgi:aminopeptidase N